MLNTQIKATLKGRVTNYKVKETKTGKKFATITLKSDSTNSYISAKMFENKNPVKYGEKEYTVSQLKNVFLNEAGESRGVSVCVIATMSVFNAQNGPMLNINVVSIYPRDDDEEHGFVFFADGFLGAVKTKTKDDMTTCKARINIYATRGQKEDKSVVGLQFAEYYAEGEIADELGELDKGSFVKINGEISSNFSVDRFGRREGSGETVLKIVELKGCTEADEVSDEDKELYKKAKSATVEEPINIKKFLKKFKDDDDDDDDEDEEIVTVVEEEPKKTKKTTKKQKPVEEDLGDEDL